MPLKCYRILVFNLLIGFYAETVSAFQKPSKFDHLVTISTTFGEMKVVLFDDTPLHKENFLMLAKDGYYDSLLFHRVINDFMIQTGDPNSRNAKPGQRLGNGGPTKRIPAEILPKYFHRKGALAAARKGDRSNPKRESSGSQFYIVKGKISEEVEISRPDMVAVDKAMNELFQNTPDHPLIKLCRDAYSKGGNGALENLVKERATEFEKAIGINVIMPEERITAYSTIGGAPHLDDQYTVFGQVIVGLEVIDKIASVSVNPANRPIEDVIMSISVKKLRRKKLTKLYGYAYD